MPRNTQLAPLPLARVTTKLLPPLLPLQVRLLAELLNSQAAAAVAMSGCRGNARLLLLPTAVAARPVASAVPCVTAV